MENDLVETVFLTPFHLAAFNVLHAKFDLTACVYNVWKATKSTSKNVMLQKIKLWEYYLIRNLQ